MESNYFLEFIVTDKQKWPLLFSSRLFLITIIYLFIIYYAGPRFMKNKTPYSFKRFIQCYNIFQIIANSFLVYYAVTNGKVFAIIWNYCEPFDKIYGENNEKQFQFLYWVLLLKIVDYIETIVFVLRKKTQQVSYFHVYHHVSTVFIVWFLIRFMLHSFVVTALVLNCSVHVIMYLYYFLSTLEYTQRRILFFKKWVTIIQMAHISFIIICSLQSFYCDNTTVKYSSSTMIVNGIINLFFFVNFYSGYKKQNIA